MRHSSEICSEAVLPSTLEVYGHSTKSHYIYENCRIYLHTQLPASGVGRASLPPGGGEIAGQQLLRCFRSSHLLLRRQRSPPHSYLWPIDLLFLFSLSLRCSCTRLAAPNTTVSWVYIVSTALVLRVDPKVS